jgi:glutathione synthase/RimK-type ligase-like ATP-grasp enzyme
MQTIVVVNNPKDWDIHVPNVELVAAKTYLTDRQYLDARHMRVYNLCRSYRYQSLGYYVSLLAAARGHRVIPSITTIQDIKSQGMIRILSDEIDHLIQTSLSKLKSRDFVLSIYFGKNIAKQYDKLSKQLYNLFQTPLLRATFVNNNKRWVLQNVSPIPINEIPESHLSYMEEFAQEYFTKKRMTAVKKNSGVFDLAILVNPEEKVPPSNKKALQSFIKAAQSIGFSVETITRDDLGRVAEFDGLFIRETTSVDHHTYRLARRASAEGLVVLDDPESIVKCTNKVYLTELLNKAKIPNPKTVIVNKDNRDCIEAEVGLPCVLKQPDSAFSHGVIKATSQEELKQALDEFLTRSELIIAQEYMPTEFDWRIGVLEKQPLYACKYYMAKAHWQIYNWHAKKRDTEGNFETFPLDRVPEKVLKTAVKAASLIGDGLYGVDLKQIGDKVYVIEINDNPTIDHGVEDLVLKEDLYMTLANSFLKRIQQKKLQVTTNE